MLREFLLQESAGGILLIACAVAALLVANSPLAHAYFEALHLNIAGLSLQHWINDGLMVFFFLLVGLEIKREMLDGELATWPRRALPGIAALGGMAVPALIYVAIAGGAPGALRGWAIPSATDIAFALGVLSLLGKRAPVSLKVFLTALAILDDLGAVVIIALFYTQGISLAFLALAGLVVCALYALNRLRIHALAPYLALGGALWCFMLQSGLHATLAGVALALTIPLRLSPGEPEDKDSPLHRLEHGLSPWVAFAVVPIFGFANAGVSLAGFTPAMLFSPVPLAIALGLFAGKQIGVFGFAWVAIRLRLADLPAHATWSQFYGVSLLCGIGFTMSLFIALLAFSEPILQDEAKIGILLGSALSALAGWLIIRTAKLVPTVGADGAGRPKSPQDA